MSLSRNYFGQPCVQCGLSQDIYFASITIHPYFKENEIEIINVYSKWDHSLCIDANRRAYLFGWSEWGRIGNGLMDSVYDPHSFQSIDDYQNVIIIDGLYMWYKSYNFIGS